MKHGQHIRKIHVISNTHWDREFRMSLQKTRILLVKMMDYLLDTLERDPQYASFTMDAHTIMLEDYLEVRPENRQRIETLVKNRRLFVGPWYTLPDIPNIGGESVVRNLLYGHKVGDSFGHTMKVGYTPCSWGQTGQLPQIYALFDIPYILFYRGISLHECDTEFVWEAPDGTRALANRFSVFARYNYYYMVFRQITYGQGPEDKQWKWGRHGELPFRMNDAHTTTANYELLDPRPPYLKQKLLESIDDMLKWEADSFASPIFLGMHGHDISWPHPQEPEVIRDANAQLKGLQLIHTDLEHYCSELERTVDRKKLKLLKGERRCNLKDGMWTYLLPGTISARTYMKVVDARCEMMLSRMAEPLATLAMVTGGEYPDRYFDIAWRHMMGNHTHDANAGCAPDHVSEDVMYRYRQGLEIADGLAEESLKDVVKAIDGRDVPANGVMVGVFNSLARTRSDVIQVDIDFESDLKAKSLVIRDSRGRVVPYQLVKVGPDGSFVDNYWNVPTIFDTTRLTVKIPVKDIPALGYRTFTVEPSTKVNRCTGTQVPAANEMENALVRVKINPDGSADLYGKKTKAWYRRLAHYVDQGESGNAWRHDSPLNDRVTTSLGIAATISLVEDGPFSTTYRADLVLDVPECVEGNRRSDRTVGIPVSTFYTLKADSPRLEIRTVFDNRARDHWLRMAFPTGLKTAVACADSHFDLVQRDIKLPNRDDWKEPVVGTYPCNSFVDISDGKKGMAVIPEGLREYEVLDREDHPVLITLVRGVRIKLEVTETKKQELPDQGPQCLGRQEFRLAVCPHAGNWQTGGSFSEAQAFTTPLRSAQFGKSSGRLPREYSLLSVSAPGLVVSAVKKAEKDDDLIVRLFNPGSKKVAASLSLAVPVKRAQMVNLNEEPLQPITAAGKKVNFVAGPKKIVTLKLGLK